MGLFDKLFGKAGLEPGRVPEKSEREIPAGFKVLVADPSITTAKVIELTLSGAAVRTAATIAQARAAFSDQRPDMVIASILFPDGDGYELCRSISTDRMQPCPVILLHSAFEAVDREKAESAGAKAILTKPFEPQQLKAAVNGARASRRF